MRKMGQFVEFDGRDDTQPEACLVCEAMCPDAVDGTLTEAERRAFDKHVAGCPHCAQELGDAQRGAAWLGMLKSGKPEPPATLLARILAETTGSLHEANGAFRAVGIPEALEIAAVKGSESVAPDMRVPPDARVLPPPRLVPDSRPTLAPRKLDLNAGHDRLRVVPRAVKHAGSEPGSFRARVLSFRGLGQDFGAEGTGAGLHPRLAMTAAMAFFSIALTLNLTGVHLRDLRAERLQPAALQRSAVEAEATAVRSFQNLRVVYQVESRVSELRQEPMWEERAEPAQAGVVQAPKQEHTEPERDHN